jgi:hypothetical protein
VRGPAGTDADAGPVAGARWQPVIENARATRTNARRVCTRL